MTFDEWYDTKESVQLIPPELRDAWKQGVKMVWDAAVEETKKKAGKVVFNWLQDEQLAHMIADAIMEVE